MFILVIYENKSHYFFSKIKNNNNNNNNNKIIIIIVKIKINNNKNNIKNNSNNQKHKAKFMSNMSFEGRKLSFFGNFAVCVTAWKVSKYGVISGPYFSVCGLNTEIHEKDNNYSADSFW